MPTRRHPDSPLTRKRRFLKWMRERFFLRFHMAVILGITFLAGLFVTKVFLVQGNTDLALRYGVAVAVSYAVFLVMVALWLSWMKGADLVPDVNGGDVVDAVDALGRLSSDGAPAQGFHAGGGQFGGGGASSDFGEAAGDAASSFVPDDAEGCAVGVVIAILVVVLVVALSSLYLVYAAPTILAEVAFEALLASTLYRGVRRASGTGWLGTAVRATIVPFVLTLLTGVGFGWYAKSACPEARRSVDVVACARGR